ncbi:hypothetical protein M8C21_013440, partial [Ambrosia artemisiifolia]
WFIVSKVSLSVDHPDTKHEFTESLIEEEEGVNDHNVVKKCADIQNAISEGATSFLFTEYQYVGIFMIAFAVLIFVFLGSVNGFSTSYQQCTYDTTKMCKPALFTAVFSTVSFILGAITSVISGFLGMKIATYANARTTLEARKGVGKANIPEDDPRNPAVIADNVGDNVGDIAGMGSDLFGSYAESSCAALVVASISSFGNNHDFTSMMYPLLISSVGILVCLITTLFATDFFEVKTVKEIEPSLKNQLIISTVLMTIGIALISWIALPYSFTIFNFGVQKDVKNWQLFLCVGVGLWAGLIIGFVTEYYTSNAYSDNAGGIAEMAGMSHRIRERTDALDAAGNTTAAIGKGFAIGSAALVSLALFGAFVSRAEITTVDVLTPKVFIGLIVGAMLPYWFSAMTMKSVGKAALSMVEEVRRQFNTIPGLMEGTAKPDYATCVKISTDASIKEMIPPGALVMLTPLIVGIFFGVETLSGVLAGSLVSGVQIAISASNTGGAWDNAKKYIEAGASEHARSLGPKGSDPHKAAVIGDTVGDPLKDTSGPSLNILIKLMAVESLVFAPFFATHGGLLFKIF